MAFAQKFEFSKYKRLADAGGCSGLLCILVAWRYPREVLLQPLKKSSTTTEKPMYLAC